MPLRIENVSLSIYNIPKKKGMMELDLLDYTRAYFPTYLFDTAFIEKIMPLEKKAILIVP